MRSIVTIQRFFTRKLKVVPKEQWIQKPDDAYVPFEQKQIDFEIKYFKEYKKQLKQKNTVQNKPVVQIHPCSPKMGPYTVENPKIYNKMYRWCSCGQSLNQPFCDESHKGTAFKPLKFTIQQNVKQVNLCGCKLTKKKPFCDGQSCKAAPGSVSK